AELVPQRAAVQIPLVSVRSEPSLKYRRKYVEEGLSHTPASLKALIDWMAKNRLNVLVYPHDYQNLGYTRWDLWREQLAPELGKRGLTLEVGGHGYQSFLSAADYRASHPDWFPSADEPVANGSPPATVFHVTNAEALGQYIRNVVSYLQARPEIGIFDAWPPDNARWAKSDIDRLGSIPNANAYVTMKLSNAIQQTLPHVRVETVAYGAATRPPSEQYMYDVDTIIDFAPHNRSYTQLISDPSSSSNSNYVSLITDWRAGFGGNISLYEYYRKYTWHSLPVVLPKLIGQEVPYYDSIGVNGFGIYSEPADWLTYELTHRLVAALSWDTSLDPSAYVTRYVTERYGPAAGAVASYLSHVESAGRAIFSGAWGSYGSLAAMTDARASYLRARDAMDAARTTVAGTSPESFLLTRLSRNVAFALADTEISYYQLSGDRASASAARERAWALLQAHRFDGIILKDWYLTRRYPVELASAERAWTHLLYRTRDVAPPSGSVLVAGGSQYSITPRVTVALQATDSGTGVRRVRLSNSPKTTTGVLTLGRTYSYTSSLTWDLSDTATGGSKSSGTRTVYAQWQDRAGNWSGVRSDSIVLDTTSPVIRAPSASLITGSTIANARESVPVRISWSASDASGVARYGARRSADGATPTDVGLPIATASTITKYHAPGSVSWRYDVRAKDRAGNVSGWATGNRFSVGGYQETATAITYYGAWIPRSYSAFWGGKALYTGATGRKATLTFRGSRVGWVSTRGPNRGKAEVLLDGVRKAVIDLYSPVLQPRRLVFSIAVNASVSHKLEVRPLGTKNAAASKAYVDVDGFVLLR
ncbi:MAG: DUF4838 domain-containing protein, partial [Chloroflexota bacterium]|nr:DUF4838 domain-containing protein [Chloroflexota bacterium]